jgi:hypothetical protein
MAWEDFWWDVTEDIKNKGLQKEFDAQLKKMSHQDKHKYKDTRDKWAYAWSKVTSSYKENKPSKK